ncbi:MULTISPECIES: hypothetical protein [Citrobacter]|uniref:hypothetical protein n=1 Tax=Citrobacter TaxID=544 RepID=UPI0008F85B71|nr:MULTISPECIES: hypothetical protein [Citrobacter]MBM6613097.1 hypothetical protein [Citrobacter portucalensis]MDM2910037.1 hypothetical protein [Citrobacter sp. Cpo012]NKD24833.1 hypothetical protein [Citrobacter freundii]OIK43314.1 hypothetical protein BED30_16190 [Citrobacter portucalensis]
MKLFILTIIFFSFNSFANCYISDGGTEFVEKSETLTLSSMNNNKFVLRDFGFKKTPMCRNIWNAGVDTVFDIEFPPSPYFKVEGANGRFIYLKANYPSSPKEVPYSVSIWELSYISQDINKINNQVLTFSFDVISSDDQIPTNVKNLSEGFQVKFVPKISSQSGATPNTGHAYVFTLKPDIRMVMKTCKFSDGVLNAPDVTIRDLRGKAQSFLRLTKTAGEVAFICNAGLSSNSFRYHFESNNVDGSILKNEDEKISTGAGDVGFEISLDGADRINFDDGRSKNYNLLNFKDINYLEQKIDLVLYGKYVAYSNDIRMGSVRSLVRVVVEYY